MKLLGFSAQRASYETWQQNPVLVRLWEREIYTEIRAEARQLGATIYFADQSGIRFDYHTGTTWALVGLTPVVSITGRCLSRNMISAVSSQGEFRFVVHQGSAPPEVFKSSF